MLDGGAVLGWGGRLDGWGGGWREGGGAGWMDWGWRVGWAGWMGLGGGPGLDGAGFRVGGDGAGWRRDWGMEARMEGRAGGLVNKGGWMQARAEGRIRTRQDWRAGGREV